MFLIIFLLNIFLFIKNNLFFVLVLANLVLVIKKIHDMFTVWYFLWNIIFFVYTLFFNFVVKFIFNKNSNVLLETENVLLKFLNNIYFNLSPINILNKNRSFSNNSLFDFYLNRSHSYPFLSEIVGIFDINTSVNSNINVDFKSLYKEFTFYSNTPSAQFAEFSNNYLISNKENYNNVDFLNFILLSRIIYNNFFFSFKKLGFYSEKNTYSYILNFIFFYYIKRNYRGIKNVSQLNLNFIVDSLNPLYFSGLNNLRFKEVNVQGSELTVLTNASRNVKSALNYLNTVSLYVQWTIKTKTEFVSQVVSSWPIKFSNSSIVKYINFNSLNNYTIYYLRKTKVFNKGRYSRNRQTYRTGVYWSLYVNIIAMVGLFFWFYRFTINFGYLWWLLFIFLASFLIPKAVKYRFYNPVTLVKSFVADILWLSSQFLIIKDYSVSLFTSVLKWLKKFW